MGPVTSLSKSDIWDRSQPKGKVTYGTGTKKSSGTGPNLKRKKHLGSIPDQKSEYEFKRAKDFNPSLKEK